MVGVFILRYSGYVRDGHLGGVQTNSRLFYSLTLVPANVAKKKTKVIEDDWTPVWNEEFTFSLTVQELALLRIEVREHDRLEKDDFGGQTCLPVSELRPGIRAVQLYNKKGDKLKSVKLLMRFQFV